MVSDNGFILKRILAIAFFILLNYWQVAECQETILDSVFTFRAGVVKTGNALSIITRQTGYNFTYDSRLIDQERKTDMTFSNMKLNVILDQILNNDSLKYTVINKYIIISRSMPAPYASVDSLRTERINYITGIVLDDASDEPLPFATIGLKNSGTGTVTNSTGEFGLNIVPERLDDTLSVSYLGFTGREIPVKQALGNNFIIRMKRDFIPIPEIIIRTQVPQEIIYKSNSAISRNYGNTPAMLTGFYREGVMKKRKIENIDFTDTLAVRLKAGLSTCLELDGVRNTFDFMSKESMDEYTYRISDIVTFDDEAAYVIDFEQKENVDRPLFRGSIYINTDDFAVLHADFELHPRYIHKMKNLFISSSARGFTTWPVTVKYSVSYRKVNGRYFLNHVRGDLVFTSKQKRKLFNSQFNVFFELAVTNINIKNVSRFEREELAPIHSVFSKTITSYDSQFWGNQDFLKPEENLLQALENMQVRLQEFSE
jgi:hypothetical protein